MTRRLVGDNAVTWVVALADGYPGAISVCAEILAKSKEIDKDSPDAARTTLSTLDELEIYGKNIYILWDKVCLQDVGRLTVLLRAFALGVRGASAEEIRQAIKGEFVPDLNRLSEEVKGLLPNFDPKGGER